MPICCEAEDNKQVPHLFEPADWNSPSHLIQHPQHHWVPRRREWKSNRSKTVHTLMSFVFWPNDATRVQFVQKKWGNCSSVRRDFCLVRSLEVNMKILAWNCIFVQDFHLFLLMIQILEQPPQSADFPYSFSYLLLLLPLCRQFT